MPNMQDRGARHARHGRPVLWLAIALVGAGAGLLWFMRRAHAAPSFAGTNVIVVLVDALRADRLGAFPRGAATSPFIDELAERAVRFENASSTASQTVPSVLSLWSSAYPSRHGNSYFHDTASFRLPERKTSPQVPDALPLMAQLFGERGYRTGAVVTNPWLQSKWGFARGFERYEFISRARGPVVNRTGLEMIDAWDAERPFLLYLHYMDVHFPRHPLDAFQETFTAGLPGKNVYVNGEFPDLSDEDRDYSIAAYDACVRSMARCCASSCRSSKNAGSTTQP